MPKGGKQKHKVKPSKRSSAPSGQISGDRKSKKQQHGRSGVKWGGRVTSEFARQLEAEGWYVNAIEGDGNCMFRSIADQFTNEPERHAEFRRRIVNYIRANRDYFAMFMEDDETIDKYIQRYLSFFSSSNCKSYSMRLSRRILSLRC